MLITEALTKVVDGQNLTRDEASGVLRGIMTGENTPAQIAALLTALRVKGETVEEVTGFAETMRALATRINSKRSPLVDTCGTGGDRSGTFNISTTAAFVVAGAGAAVAKHGNRSASSKCGSADVLEALGVNLDVSPETVGECIDDIGIGFLYARALHSAMKHVGPVRQELGFRTVFNLLGPLTNPAGADGQVMGVYDEKLVLRVANVLRDLGTRHAFVVCGSDGLDEITLTGPTRVAEVRDGQVAEHIVSPEEFGFERVEPVALLGGEAEDNARILREVLSGKIGAPRNIVLMNAAPAIVAGGQADDLDAGVAAAAAAIDSGAAQDKLDQLIKATNA